MTHLRDKPGRCVQFRVSGRLNRVDDDKNWIERLDLLYDEVEIGFRQQVELGRAKAQAVSAQFNLSGAFFATDVENLAIPSSQQCSQLQDQGGLADARLAAQQVQ